MPSFTLVPILSLLSFLASISGAYAGIQHHPASALGLRNHRNALRAVNATRASENAPSELQKRGAGEFTVFTPGDSACGGFYTASDFIVALNIHDWDNGAHCYKMITITVNGKSTQAQIVDECLGCPPGGLDFSPAIFRFYDHVIDGIIEGSWSYNDGDGNDGSASTSKIPPSSSKTSLAPTISAKSSTLPSLTPTSTSSSSSSSPSSSPIASQQHASSSSHVQSSSKHTVLSSTSIALSARPTSAPAMTSSTAPAQQTLSPDDSQFLNVVNIAILRMGSMIEAGIAL
ncbi:hypothetical protein HETIRDRAFT_406954 [Heterobasidion irregulare TC 32-1]|uniref:Non-catalytic module family EXPN protein n=1 Tax=Heterobasidion irregulare (strain TC 32-1) TaxID=747525 RepID=W4KN47_HETIT|nr:uncharacterized protein HETIRDRAFT_406954 [Heterobasidion irregulare TC 32-1]ETW87242.1 hypothetical protein HETIRDRAFT_406954 [Heterobasidion irregulare TC 32-1]